MVGNWSDEEVFKLIELWGDDAIQAKLEGCKRNKEVYKKIARGMREAGYDRSADQCRDNAKKLKAEYQKIKDTHNKTGTDRNNCKFWMPSTRLGRQAINASSSCLRHT